MNAWNLEIRDFNLRVLELTGQHDGIPILCLHGWLDQGAAFAEVAQGRRGRWLAPDQRGFGQSDHLPAGARYQFADHVADLDALVEAVGSPVHLVGHSMGATVACLYAGARPSAVASLVVLDGLGAIESPDTTFVSRMGEFLSGQRHPPKTVKLASKQDAAERLKKRHPGLSPQLAVLLAEHGTRTTPNGLAWSFDPVHMARFALPFKEDIFLEFLAAIRAPTLVVWASQSIYPPQVQQRRASTIPNAAITTLEGSHMLPYDAPNQVGDLIEAHIRGEFSTGSKT